MVKKTALVFGATGGIGKEIVRELSGLYNLGLSSTSIDFKNSNEIYAKKADIRKSDEVKAVVSGVYDKFNSIDVLINSAGVINTCLIKDFNMQALELVFAVNVFGFINVVKAVLPIMISQKRGHIILIGSLRSFKSAKEKSIYCMSKAAIKMFADVLRKEVKKYEIKVTLINPGNVDTALYAIPKRPFLIKPDGTFEQLPITLPDDIARSISFLLSLSDGATVEEFNIGELFGERHDVCLREVE